MRESKRLYPIALVVEDDEDQRDLIGALLEETGMWVVGCDNAEAAEVAMGKYGTDIAFLFTDVSLAGPMTGVELARIAKHRYPHLSVVVTSGRPCSGLPEDAVFFPKPWSALNVLIAAEKSVAGRV